MCGFVGFTNYINDDGVLLGSMMDKIVHRGPDAAGGLCEGTDERKAHPRGIQKVSESLQNALRPPQPL